MEGSIKRNFIYIYIKYENKLHGLLPKIEIKIILMKHDQSLLT